MRCTKEKIMIYVTFKTKTEVFEFAEKSFYSGVGGKVVSTPKEIKLGCGYSVAASDGALSKVRSLISSGDYPTFHGVFRIKKEGTKTVLAKLF